MALILSIEDDQALWGVLRQMLAKMGCVGIFAPTRAQGLAMAEAQAVDVVLLDLDLPDGDGLAILPQLLRVKSQPQVIILTGAGDRQGAELAFNSGAWDFLQKPFLQNEVALSLKRALQFRETRLARSRPVLLDRAGIVGESPAIKACLSQVAAAAASRANVLLSGPTGSGKELFARAIHANSPRAAGNFVVVDCTVLPENLVGSLLFGHKKGAFTGAERDQAGLVRQAHNGTLFLDEVGELPMSLQRPFLRVLQERRFRPLGAEEEVESDFRLVAATNRDLAALVARGEFRDDLLFRLKTLHIDLPPLGDRLEDVKTLVFHHLSRLCREYGLEQKGLSPEVFRVLTSYGWPGNVRELINVLEEALAALGPYPTIYPFHLPTRLRLGQVIEPRGCPPMPIPPLAGAEGLPDFQTYRQMAADLAEAAYLEALLHQAGENRAEALALSKLSRSRLYALLSKHGLPAFGRKT